MPCYDGGDRELEQRRESALHGQIIELTDQVKMLEASLCAVLRVLEEDYEDPCDQIDEKRAGISSYQLAKWWQKHKIDDEARHIKETATQFQGDKDLPINQKVKFWLRNPENAEDLYEILQKEYFWSKESCELHSVYACLFWTKVQNITNYELITLARMQLVKIYPNIIECITDLYRCSQELAEIVEVTQFFQLCESKNIHPVYIDDDRVAVFDANKK